MFRSAMGSIGPGAAIAALQNHEQEAGLRIESLTHGLAGILAHNPAVGAGRRDTPGRGTSGGVLDHLLSLALEISRRSSVRLAHCVTSDRAGLLCPGRPRTTQSVGARGGRGGRAR